MMENNSGSAVYCGNCRYVRRGEMLQLVLGSITADGVLLVKRAHNLTTKIRFTHPFMIYCECGYEALINPSLEQTDYAQQN